MKKFTRNPHLDILIIGGGGREHAIAWKIAQSPLAKNIWVAPGNAGTEQEPKVKNVAINPSDIARLIQFAQEKNIDLTIVGPEIPLALGIVDQFQAEGLRCFGPSQKASQLESSKKFSKEFMANTKIPTAKFQTFTEINSAIEYLHHQTFPIVIKADGLAAGKGVIIANNFKEAEKAVQDMLERQTFGNAGSAVVIEEFLQGEELSFIVMSDGKNILPLASSQDHKRRDDGDLGPNTGGMGAYSPSPLLTPALQENIINTIIEPVIENMASQGTPYIGFLYAGLMITKNEEPYVLEFNCRLGDPETQVILMRLQSDLVELCEYALEGKLNKISASWDPRVALTVVMAAGGYPDHYEKGHIIDGLDLVLDSEGKIFHAGTQSQNHHILTQGGRVLCVTALGKDVKMAQEGAYQMASKISWKNCYFRKDIGYRALKK